MYSTINHMAFAVLVLICVFLRSTNSSLLGTWHVNDNGYPFQTNLERSVLYISSNTSCDFWKSSNESNPQYTKIPCEIIEYKPDSSFYLNNSYSLEFTLTNPNNNDSTKTKYVGQVLNGVLKGYTCFVPESSSNTNDCSSVIGPVTGWNQNYIDTKLLASRNEYYCPRDYLFHVFDEGSESGSIKCKVHFRIDWNISSGEYIGRFKMFYADGSVHGEQLEYDVIIELWNNTHLSGTVKDYLIESQYLYINAQVTGYPFNVNNNNNSQLLQLYPLLSNNLNGTLTISNETRFSSDNKDGNTDRNKDKNDKNDKNSVNYNFCGYRWNILTNGITSDSVSNMINWQEKVRNQMQLLLMFGNPQAVSINADVVQIATNGSNSGVDRDDNYIDHAQNYSIYNVHLDVSIPQFYGYSDVTRKMHGYFAIPNTGPLESVNNSDNSNDNINRTAVPLLVGCNGHGGSSWQTMFPTNTSIYWYGDATARRNYYVLAVDISHRNDTPMYSSFKTGDDPEHGNYQHPSIMYDNFNFSLWEEDGERSYDVLTMINWLVDFINNDSSGNSDKKGISINNIKNVKGIGGIGNGINSGERFQIDVNNVFITGLSMGGEITTFTSGLMLKKDNKYGFKIKGAIAAGFSPDLDVMMYHGNHPCWRWMNANGREYMDTSLLHALIAGSVDSSNIDDNNENNNRFLIVQTGQKDSTYSYHKPPYSSDKQVMRRSRQAFLSFANNNGTIYDAFSINAFHYLHFDQHRWHAGDLDIDNPSLTHKFVRIPNKIGPVQFGQTEWQNDANTSVVVSEKNGKNCTIYDLLKKLKL